MNQRYQRAFVTGVCLTDAEQRKMLKNGRRLEIEEGADPVPIVLFFTPDANASWMLVALDPNAPDYAYGLGDLGVGAPEEGWVSLTELRGIRGALGLPVERDLYFKPTKPLSAYVADALRAGRIVK